MELKNKNAEFGIPSRYTLFITSLPTGFTYKWVKVLGSNVLGNTAKTPTEVKINLFWLRDTNVSEGRAASIFAVKHMILDSSMNLLSVSRVQA
jgi:hypothetical protein